MPEYHESLGTLGLKELLFAVSLITSQYYRVLYHRRARHVDTLGRWLKGGIKNAEVHMLLCKAMVVFRDWPNNYFSFLEWRRQHLGSSKQLAGIKNDFGQFELALRGQLKSKAFDFMREAFDEFITRKWDGGYASQIRRLKGGENRKFMSKQEASKSLGVCPSTIDDLLTKGRLRAVTKRHRRSRMMLIEAISVDELKAERTDLLDRKQTAKRLGINTIQTQVLFRAELLTEREAYDHRSEAFYSIREVDALVSKTTTVRKHVQLTPKIEIVDFAQALYHLACHHDISVAQFVQAIIDSTIRPCHVTDEPGFRALRFLRRDVVKYQESIFRQRYPDALNTLEAAKVLRTHPKIVRFLIKKKLLGSLRVRWWLAIPHTAISDFCSKYVLTQALAKEFHTLTRFMTNVLETEGIRPIPGSIVHHKPSYYVFHRSDVDRINLTELIKTKRERVTSHSKLLDIIGAAKFLNVKPETMLEIVANGVLTPRVTATRKRPAKNYFTERHLRRLSGRVERYSGLVTAKNAAGICGRSVSNFNARLANRNALEIIHVDGDRSRFFRKTEVKELAARLKTLVGASDVRSTLRLSQSQLSRLIESGDLRPVHGPNVDGSPLNLFSQNDVEVVRKRREYYKRKRVREGGSQRFGKPAGPQRSPVIEAITSRVKELMTEAAVNGTRMSGRTIHKHLVKEGHKMGINSVYVCIRKARSSTSVHH